MLSSNDDQKELFELLSALLYAVVFSTLVVGGTCVIKEFRGGYKVSKELYQPPSRSIEIKRLTIDFFERVANSIKTETEILCLQKNIYFEARNQPLEGQIAVGLVTLNRVSDWRYPDSFCGVVYDPYQFSWTHQGVDNGAFIRNTIDQQSWNTARNISMMIINNDVENYLPSVLHYHADRVSPHWANSKMKRVFTQIGDHIFYQLKT